MNTKMKQEKIPKKKRKENMNKVPRLLILLGYRTLNIFCTKLKVKKCLRECASTYELGAVRKQCKPSNACISAYQAYLKNIIKSMPDTIFIITIKVYTETRQEYPILRKKLTWSYDLQNVVNSLRFELLPPPTLP